jgi:putative membrane protein insertion efficiency factor
MRRIVIALIRGYQYLISPLYTPTCRFTPSCSNYARDVVAKHGVLKGGWLSIRRLLRCNPWNPGGYDPAP